MRTDGVLPVIDVSGVPVGAGAAPPPAVAAAAAGFAVPDGPSAAPDPDAAILGAAAPSHPHAHRPPKLLLALAMLMTSFIAQCTMLAWAAPPPPPNVTVHLVTTAVSLIALLALSSDEVRDWVRHRGRENRRPRRDGGRRKAIAKG